MPPTFTASPMTRKHPIIEAVKAMIRQPYAWPGGYSIILIMADGEPMCPKCAKGCFREIVESTKCNDRDGWTAAGVEVYWEGPALNCCQCGIELASEYGDPDNPE